MSMRLYAYQALLSNQQNVARVQRARQEIERMGGRVRIAPPSKVGMVLVVMELPEGALPEHFVPGVPFYPM